ncbi:MAG TPA: amino acid permease, partial [Candidatus Acidoferrum sp.]|nr:amino acid permease [Candidatus Acidoferrum sp.]
MIRGVGLRSATAINVATMVGAGPFITLPLVVAALAGSVSAAAWLVGALIALCDGLVWAELASRFPRSGGTYAYLREAFGAHGAGRLLAFLFVWQFLFWAPLTIASGYIGFAQYAAYLVPALAAPLPTHLVAAVVGLITLATLYRAIPQVARLGLVLGTVALVTLVVVACAGFAHPRAPLAETFHATLALGFALPALGSALVITLYDYAGYADVCALGDEVIAPARTIPRAVVLSVCCVGAAYLLLNLGVVTALTSREIAQSSTVAALVAERAFGVPFAAFVTLAVLVTAFGSTYGLLLAAARVPYAAATDGDFLAPFARLHPSGRFPHVALVAIGLLALPASLLPLDAVIKALTAGIVLVQGVGQVVALAVVRAARPEAPFRVPLYPLPALVALCGWLFLFWSSGAPAIAFGLVTLALGALVFLLRAWRRRSWPFVAAIAGLAVAFIVAAPPASADPSPAFGHAVVVERAGEPVLTVDGVPFFFFGGAFFYERIPPSRWRASMLAMRSLGANTLDLYVPWNWHEIADGDFDFDGRTNPRRNLREVLRLGAELGFRFIVRPGPVIRNEWRNGGYPAWLLERPEYAMPLRDVLDGRYPATATLQNAHSDDAAAEWMRNGTHRRYASRWLHRVLAEFRPVADRVIAVQLDDDQGAYIDNQTWPAPHLAAYLRWLDAQVRDVVGPATPTFINTYEMRVPASSPVWTMGNWYQSDALSIGEHDRGVLDFATSLLETNRRGPLAQSEFQAGWLAGPEDPLPRAADPTNTALALHELLAQGVHGVIDFPMQDTLAPFGWEAPFSNALYAWDAAYDLQLEPTPRAAPTRAFGELVARFGTLLAQTHPVRDVAIAWLGGAYARPLTGGEIGTLTARTTEILRACRASGQACVLVDPARDLLGARTLVVPAAVDAPLTAGVTAAIEAASHRGVHVRSSLPPAPAALADATVLTGPGGTFVDVRNWDTVRHTYRSVRVSDGKRLYALPTFVLAGRSAVTLPLSVDLGSRDAAADEAAQAPSLDPPSGAIASETIRLGPSARFEPVAMPAAPRGGAIAERADVFEDGGGTIVMRNAVLRVIVAPEGGGRIVEIGDGAGGNATDATGATRDGLIPEEPPSPRDFIGRYTHDYPNGTGQRRYDATILSSGACAVVQLRGTASDLGASFERIVTLAPDAHRIVVDERVRLTSTGGGREAVARSSLPGLLPGPDAHELDRLPRDGTSVPGPTAIPPFVAGYLTPRGEPAHVTVVAWLAGDVEALSWTPYRSTGTLALTQSPGRWHRTVYAYEAAPTLTSAREFAEEEAAWVAANPATNIGEVAKRYTRSPQKRP